MDLLEYQLIICQSHPIQILDLIQNLIVNEINDNIDNVSTVELPNALIQHESIDASPETPERFKHYSQNQNSILSSQNIIPNSQGKSEHDFLGGTINTNNFTIDENNKDTLFLFEDLKRALRLKMQFHIYYFFRYPLLCFLSYV